MQAIFFDAAGTLIHLPRGAAYHYAEIAAKHGLHLEHEPLRSSFRAAWEEMPMPATTRIPRPDDDRGWWRELVNRTLDQYGAAPRSNFDREAYFLELYAEFRRPGVWALYPEVLKVLAELRGRFVLGIMSNFDGRLRQVLADLGLGDFFREIIISSEVGADKPDPWIFSEAARRVGIQAQEVLHVGDEPVADWQGAAAAGFQVFRLNRPGNSLLDLLKEVDRMAGGRS